MAGARPGNLDEGDRSEILADYLLSSWGPVTPVRRQDDFGLDLYCTLTERFGRRERVNEYFTVQVKSTDDPWIFEDAQSVQWLIDYPTPLFLCTVSKQRLKVRIYHVAPRFYVSAYRDKLPDTLELVPEEGLSGKLVQWVHGSTFSLSAPIIEAGIKEMTDRACLQMLRSVFAHWVRFDRENCDLVRQGLPRFRVPGSYTTNEIPESGPTFQRSNVVPGTEMRRNGLLRLAEALECVGGWHSNQGDFAFALEAALLLDRLQTQNADLFQNTRFLRLRVPSAVQAIVLSRLNRAIGEREGGELYAGLEAVQRMMRDNGMIQKYLAGERVAGSEVIAASDAEQPQDC